MHESAVVIGAPQILHEGTVDLDQIDAELAQVAERRGAGAEVVNRDPATEILDARNETARIVDIVEVTTVTGWRRPARWSTAARSTSSRATTWLS
jgi:hypothetical protein